MSIEELEFFLVKLFIFYLICMFNIYLGVAYLISESYSVYLAYKYSKKEQEFLEELHKKSEDDNE